MAVEKNELQLRKKQQMKKKAKNRIKRRLIVFLFLFVCTAIIFTVLKAPFFNVKTIVCVGQESLTEEQIIEIAGAKLNANIFSTGVKTMKRRLLENPAIAESNVRRLFPNKIKIWVREAKTAMYIENDKSYVLVNDTGRVIKSIDKTEERPKAAKLVDFVPASEVPGENIIAKDDVSGQTIIECVKALKKLDMLEKITSISAADLSDIRIDYEDRLYILLGSFEQMDYKLNFVKKVISENISEYEKALLDYRGKNLFVGPREDPDDKKEVSDENDKTDNPESDKSSESTDKPDEKPVEQPAGNSDAQSQE